MDQACGPDCIPGRIMIQPEATDRDTTQCHDDGRDDTPAGSIERSKSMTIVQRQSWLKKLVTTSARYRQSLVTWIQRIPLTYKLAFFITVLIVTCMGLLGTLLIDQQSRLIQKQINEQGNALIQLMAQSAREPLLAGDELALNVITGSFANSDSILSTAIISLQGEIIAHEGKLHEGKGQLGRYSVIQLMDTAPTSHTWNWQPYTWLKRHMVTTFIHPVTFQGVTAGYALVTFSQASLQQSVRQAVNAIAGATLLIIILGIAMAFALGRRITQPIDRLVDASKALGKGEYTFKFKERRHDELGLLMEAFNDMAEGMLEKSQVKDALSRYVSPSVAREILSNLDDVELSGKRIQGSVLFADISGFTQISEDINPEELVTMLNRYFSIITRACELNGGMVDKYMGDGVMLVFGAPDPDEEHAFHAIRCALLIQRLVEHENRERGKQGLFPVKFRVGLNTGVMLAGNMGSRQRMDYTVVGDTVNLASRICGITNSGKIVISREMYMHASVKDRVLGCEYQPIKLRGISQPVVTYEVENLKADWQESIDSQFEQLLRTEKSESGNA